MRYDNYLEDKDIINELGVQDFNNFVKDNQLKLNTNSLNIVKLLLTQEDYTYNDFGLTLNDYNYYKDVLFYLEPLIYLENRYTFYFDDEFLTIKTAFKGQLPKYNYTSRDIYNIIEKIGLKTSKFKTDFFKNLNEEKFKKFLKLYKKGI